jgi:hypothetical protein
MDCQIINSLIVDGKSPSFPSYSCESDGKKKKRFYCSLSLSLAFFFPRCMESDAFTPFAEQNVHEKKPKRRRNWPQN